MMEGKKEEIMSNPTVALELTQQETERMLDLTMEHARFEQRIQANLLSDAFLDAIQNESEIVLLGVSEVREMRKMLPHFTGRDRALIADTLGMAESGIRQA
jgi:hypothetical protein